MQGLFAVADLLDRAAIRRRISRIKPFRTLRARARAARRRVFQPGAALAPASAAIVADIDRDGICVVDQQQLPWGDSRAELGHAADLIAASTDDRLEAEAVFTRRPSLYLLGLDPVILTLVEHYLGEACLYHGCALKRERVGTGNGGTRQWHRDVEDDRMFRIIVYLDAVDEDTGPFEYVPADRSAWITARSGYSTGYVTDGPAAVLIEEPGRQSACGPAGTAVCFDGTRVFHRASPPLRNDRLSLTLTYSSRYPLETRSNALFGTGNRRRLLAMLSARQQACVPVRRMFGLLR